jgi:hypothetical protein
VEREYEVADQIANGFAMSNPALCIAPPKISIKD